MAPRLPRADIPSYDSDAIVSAADDHIRLGAGVAGAIRRAGSASIQKECGRLGPMRVGEAAITDAGDLPFDVIVLFGFRPDPARVLEHVLG